MPSRRMSQLREEEIQNILNESEFEELEDDDLFNLDDDDVYIPAEFASGQSSSSGSSGTESDNEAVGNVSLQGSFVTSSNRRSRGRGVRSRGGSRRSRGRGVRYRCSGETRNYSPDTSHTQQHPAAGGKKWVVKQFTADKPQLSQPSYIPVDSENFTKLDYFTQYIDEDLIDIIVQTTNQTSVHKTGRSVNFTKKECKVFIGITMIMSCINYPIIRMYWENKWRVAAIADNMPRNRFFQIRTSVKLVFDPEISAENRQKDKLWKVRPIIDRVVEGCRKQDKSQEISIDEMIIPFTGACGIKQYCPGKPNPVGLKALVLANPNGIVCDFIIYQGKTTFSEEEYAEYKLGEKSVLKLIETLVPGHIIYFDRYFTTANLIEELNNRGIKSTGTLMKNRIPSQARQILESDHSLKSKGRGSHQVIVREDDKLSITKWYDNKPVIMMSSTHSDGTVDECKRWCKKEKRYVVIKRPEVIKFYNTNMGGVDLADRMLSVCPARSRTNKWTVRFISHMLDLSITNSWLLYRQDQLKKNLPLKKIQQCRFFKMELGEILIERNAMHPDIIEQVSIVPEEMQRKRGRPAVVPLPSKIVRTHGANHMPEMEGGQHKCRKEGCKMKTCIKCSTCNIFLCLTKDRNCFKLFHE